jgi:large subunit ribosomal protein L9
MKVLLKQNIRKLGLIGEIVEVKGGYARNYLIPQGLGTQPTEANIRQVDRAKEAYLAQVARDKVEIEARAKLVDGKEVTIAARANEEGHLYGSIGPAQIAQALADEGTMIEASAILLSDPLRQLDKYDLAIEFGEDVTASVTVWVVPLLEDGTPGERTTQSEIVEAAQVEVAAVEQAAQQAEDAPVEKE